MAHGSATRSALTVEPSVHSAGRAVVLLGISTADVAGRRYAVDGRRVQAIGFGRLALLVSFVDSAAYAGAEVERKRDDAAWVAREALALEKAVERARSSGPVLPVRLLTIFPNLAALEATARENNTRWSRSLARLGSKRESLVRLYAGPHVAPGRLPSPLRVAQGATRSARAPALKAAEPVAGHALRLWRECTSVSLAVRRVGSGNERGALWAAAFLLPEHESTVLEAALERSAVDGAKLGITVYLEVSHAPFSFV